MTTEKLTNVTLKAPIEALQNSTGKAWLANFAASAELCDDGNKNEFK